jgi:small-conductance mechanosensitive channel
MNDGFAHLAANASKPVGKRPPAIDRAVVTRRATGLVASIALFALFASGDALGATRAAAGASDASAATAAAAPEVAPVVVDGRTLMRLRGVSVLPAEQRAEETTERIIAIAADRAIAASTLRRVELADRSSIVAGDSHVLFVVDSDAAAEGMADRKVLADLYLREIVEAIDRYRDERTAAYLRGAALRSLGVALATALLVALAVLVFRRFEQFLQRRLEKRIEAVQNRSFSLVTVSQLQRTTTSLVRALRWLVVAALVYAAIEYALGQFPWTRAAGVATTSLVLDPLRTMGRGIVAAIPGLAFVAILIVITRYVLRLVQLFFGGIAAHRIRLEGFEEEWAWPTYRLARIAIIAFAAVIAYPYIPGSSSDAFKAISIFFGLLMSLGAASAVANNLAGYMLIYRRAFRVGDRIRVGEHLGDVVEMRQQVTHLRTTKNEIVTVPSVSMLSSEVVNYSALARTEGLVLHTTVGIGYDTPWRQVEAMLLEAASRTTGLKADAKPFVQVKSLDSFCITYEINAPIEVAQEMNPTYSALHRNILDVFNEYGVGIMTPSYESDPEAPKVVAREKWYEAPAMPPQVAR